MRRRAAGILLHPTSLPEDPGGLVASAKRFLAWAGDAGFTIWQVLPLGPAGPGGSPYSSYSAFAGDPGWFPKEAGNGKELDAFTAANESWLPDWCLFAALKEKHHGRAWIEWDEPLRKREPEALSRAKSRLAAEIVEHRRAQFAFHRGWSAIRDEARRCGISILGDVPIYPAFDSADVWAHQDLFHLDECGRPTKLAGVPPDYFSETGQLWGNPLYRWDQLAATGFKWWIDRLRHALTLHDRLRLDHFRGFAGYWAVPAGAATAETGSWETGPGMALFEAVSHALGALPFVAEDLGIITHDVVTLRKTLGLPGMRVLQFGLTDPASEHALHNFERDTVVYTGTHDNDTTKGWFASLPADERSRVLDYVGGAADDIAWSVVRAAFTSVADVAIVPMQDVLGLGSGARMNVPGKANGNWTWKAEAAAFDPARARNVRLLSTITVRFDA